MFLQPRFDKPGMMPTGIIQDDDHDMVFPAVARQLFEEREKGFGIECLFLAGDQLSISGTDGSIDADIVSCRGMKHYWINIFRRDPHDAS